MAIQVLSIESIETTSPAINAFFSKISDIELTEEVEYAEDAFKCLKEKKVDVVLIDLGLPDACTIEVIKEIRRSHPAIRVVIFTASNSDDDIFSAMDAGADGYVLKDNHNHALEAAIRSVKLGTVFLDPDIAKQVIEVIANSSLSKKGRTLPTGLMTMPLLPDDQNILNEVAGSNCVDGVCMVDPSFLKKLRRFGQHND